MWTHLYWDLNSPPIISGLESYSHAWRVKFHPRIPRGDSARYINIVDVASEITPGYPRMVKFIYAALL